MNSSFVPIYKKLFDLYKGKIVNQEIKPGHQIDSITRIMQRHGVSRETAKLVLKMLIRDRLIISRAGKGSFVAPFAETKKIWGMVIPFYSSNMEQLINYLDLEAGKRGRKLTYFFGYNNPEEEMRLVGEMIMEGYEAVIVVPNNDESLTAEFYRKLLYGNTSVVLVDNTMSGSYFRYVIQSYDLGVKRVIDYLVSKTRKNLLLVKNESWKGRNLLYEFMEQTFTNIVSANYPNRKVFVISNMKEFTHKFIADNRIGGVLCCADTDAVRVIGRLQKRHVSIPREISIVSYGNTALVLGCWKTEVMASLRQSAEATWPQVQARLERLLGLKLQKLEIVPCDPPEPRAAKPPVPDYLETVLRKYRSLRNQGWTSKRK